MYMAPGQRRPHPRRAGPPGAPPHQPRRRQQPQHGHRGQFGGHAGQPGEGVVLRQRRQGAERAGQLRRDVRALREQVNHLQDQSLGSR